VLYQRAIFVARVRSGTLDRILLKEEKFAIDLYLWFDESKGEGQKGFHYFVADGPHHPALCALLGTNPSKHRRP
jgi:hypothetical protein